MIIKNESDKQIAINKINNLNILKPWSMELKPYRKNRSLAQNKLYHMWLGIISPDTGYTTDEWHIMFRHMFLGCVEVMMNGQKYEDAISTTKLNTKEFTEYLNRIEMFSSTELGIVLPHPDDLYWEAMGVKR